VKRLDGRHPAAAARRRPTNAGRRRDEGIMMVSPTGSVRSAPSLASIGIDDGAPPRDDAATWSSRQGGAFITRPA